MTFAVLCLLLLGGTVAYLVAPIARRSRRDSNLTVAEANAAVHRDRLGELSMERQHGLITEGELTLEQGEIEQRVLADVPVAATNASSPAHRQQTVMLWLSVLILAISAGLLYLALGAPSVLVP